MAIDPVQPTVERSLRKIAVWALTSGFIFVVVGDRIGPSIFENWQQLSDWGLLVIVSAMVSLILGEAIGLLRR